VLNKEAGSAPATETLGAGERAFVCLHGLADTRSIFRPLAAGLARFGRVVLVDQRGHGEAAAPAGPYSREDLARDVIDALDRQGVARAILVGHSLGGVVALATGLAFPQRVAGLVLLGTTGQCSARIAEWYERIAVAGERDGIDGIRREIYGERSQRAIDADARGVASMVRMLATLHADPLTPKLGALRCPALLVVGEEDPMGPKASALLAEAIPGAELVVLPGLGHWTHVEAPDQVVGAVERWLEAHEKE
jgi:pimeloyl-ACP methyl ester carboxylesterase